MIINVRTFASRLAEAGYVIVPVRPTEEMLEAAKYSAWGKDVAAVVWRDMVDSVPKNWCFTISLSVAEAEG